MSDHWGYDRFSYPNAYPTSYPGSTPMALSSSQGSSGSYGSSTSPVVDMSHDMSGYQSYYPSNTQYSYGCVSPTETLLEPSPFKHEHEYDYSSSQDAPGIIRDLFPSASSSEAASADKTTKELVSYPCIVVGCNSKGRFRRPTDLRRHINTQHAPEEHRIDCEYKWCGRWGDRGFTRKDHLTEHLREVHREPIDKVQRKSTSAGTGGRR